jgi:hypothetical protein
MASALPSSAMSAVAAITARLGGSVRRAAKRDIAERGIVLALEAVGAQVYRLDRPVDLLVRYRHENYLLEVKTPKASKDPRQVAQRHFCTLWEVPIVKTPAEALIAIGALT